MSWVVYQFTDFFCDCAHELAVTSDIFVCARLAYSKTKKMDAFAILGHFAQSIMMFALRNQDTLITLQNLPDSIVGF
jgi:hypothetical protein